MSSLKVYNFKVTLTDGATKEIEASSEMAVYVKLGWQKISENMVKSIEQTGEIASFIIR